MEFSIKSASADKQKSACLVIGVYEGKKFSAAAESIDQASEGHLSSVVKLGDLEAKAGSTLLLPKVPGIAAERVLLVSLGKQADLGDKEFRDAVRAAAKTIHGLGVADAAFYLTDTPAKDRDAAWAAGEIAQLVVDQGYTFDQLKSKKDESKGRLKKLVVAAAKSENDAVEVAVRRGSAIGDAMNFAKNLGNLPPNICTPTYLADRARELAKSFEMKAEILERADIEKLGMGSFISVGKASTEPMKLIVLKHEGAGKNDKPVVLVGKGITFDSGGISLKPGEGMDEMKYDMMGAGSVLATMHAVGELKLKLNVIAIVPACENMPGGNANKPGDIVTAMNGTTIEVLNTDAEGRLILCDALTYAERFEPAAVVDVATLTGACVIALGHIATGLYSNQDSLAKELLLAGEDTADRAWHMPLWDDYQEQLKSNFADLANIGGRPGGSITAACFLSRFAKKYDWAHLDIAGTAWKSGAQKGASGRPVPLLTRFLINRAEAAKSTKK
ncbi:leucyl aminopeptidase [Parachitinimonas caeni]|uniref:Probable cytosol aminopeptidase n=1 Tax=Parachitinimonas caeni TaxID=3031301 RepID=A0ABT7DSQ3_9NEIS|nr:leucyl aminopeptidase [Parachitinimonas caeni]MDK2123092.1 leucyl aminopeptidase [Parachitinimonas caeni]